MGAIPGAKFKPYRATRGISLPPIPGAMWSGRLFDGPARLRGGSSAWRAGWTGSPGALGRSDHVSRRAACRPARAHCPGWWSCRSSQNAGQHVRRRLELGAQDVGESAFAGFDDGAGVVGDQPAQHGVGVLGIAQVPGAVELVQAGGCSRCRVPMRRLRAGRRPRRGRPPGCVPGWRRPGRGPSGAGGVPGGAPGRGVAPMMPACPCCPG